MSQHLPVSFKTQPIIEPRISKPLNQLNFWKANCKQFRIDLDATIDSIFSSPNTIMWHFPKTGTNNLKPEYSHSLLEKLHLRTIFWNQKTVPNYLKFYDQDPFSKDTTTDGHLALDKLKEKQKLWNDMIENTDLLFHQLKKC